MELHELQASRKNLLEQARAINEKAKGENRALTAEELNNYNKYFADAQGVKDQIAQAERQREVDRELAAIDADKTRRETESRGNEGESHAEISKEFRSLWLRDCYTGGARRGGSTRQFRGGLNKHDRKRMEELESKLNNSFRSRVWSRAMCIEARTTGEAFAMAHREVAAEEKRDLLMGSDPAGGFAVQPEQFQATLIRKIDDRTFIRALATKVVVTKATDLGVPTLEDNPADADWTSELATGADDAAMDFGKRSFAPHPLAKLIKVSKKLLRASAINIENLIADRFAYKFGITEEKAFLLGSGAGQPLGLFVATPAGISTGRDVNTGNTAISIGADNLRKVKYSLKAPYRSSAQWLFHRDAIAQISQLKDGMGQYLWRDGIAAGDPDMLLGMPVNESEYVPNTFTTGQYVGMLGDYSHYWIADALDMTVQRLVELYAGSNQEGFIMRQELDGMPVLEEAFVRIKLA
jgi:HK97 family phage major capsid protein